MVAGLILKDTVEEESIVGLVGDDGTETRKVSTNEELVDLMEEEELEIVAANAPQQVRRSEFNEDEEDLRDDGHIFQPSSTQKTLARRLEALKDQVFDRMGAEAPDFIRFDPHITSKELAIDGDDALESFGVETSNIRSAEEFDAVLGAVTARFYQQNQFEEKGVVVPEPMREQEDTEQA